MANVQMARLVKNSITLVEYQDPLHSNSDKFFIQSGVVGFFASKDQLRDLYDVLNYYLNIENFDKCKIVIDNQDISLIPKEKDVE